MCNCTSENLEIPRCAIAHLRSGANAPSRNDGISVAALLALTKSKKQPEETSMSQPAKRVVLVSRPVGEPKATDFRIEEYAPPVPGEGQALLRTIWLSL